MYELKTEQFSGPISVLLELIEAKKMDVADVSLAAVTADFLDHTRRLQESAQEKPFASFAADIADFLVIASRLLLIKSKTLLPQYELTEDEQADIADLKTRLELYRRFRTAGKFITQLFDAPSRLFARPFLYRRPVVFAPPPALTSALLAGAIGPLAKTMREFREERIMRAEKAVSVEKKMGEIVAGLMRGISSFAAIAQRQTRTEIIALFLALLYLMRDRRIAVAQTGVFSDIIITSGKAETV
ncbi:MAG: segregation/condensation protein A [Candidatus Liptonbacteria bacterium]|nr:segregation/condensation protein A [Candidatus Liptonbacteria bacterium]